MTLENATPIRTIDVTGLSDNAVSTVAGIVDQLRHQSDSTSAQGSEEARTRRFEEWMQQVAKRADRYPKGFVLDDSRESIYSGRNE